MKLILTLVVLTSMVFSAEGAKLTPIETTLWEKAVSENTKEADKAYLAYLKALDDANVKVKKALEANIKDLNDPKKFGKLDMKARVDAIKALEDKIAEVKKGSLGDAIVARSSGDLLGGDDVAKMIVGKWQWFDGNIVTFEKDGSAKSYINGKWEENEGKIIATWSNGSINTISVSVNKLQFSNEGFVRICTKIK